MRKNRSVIEEQLSERQGERINYDKIIESYPWIVEKNRFCVLSPDSDGLLCGLFMAKTLGWKIVGFYDDKVALINKDYTKKDLVFLDGEIYRKDVKSFGHHMLAYNKKEIPSSWENFSSCIQPNNIRKYDGKSDFRLKYPLATIHMLVSIVAYKYKNKKIVIPETGIAPLYFTDGVFNVLFSYPENVMNWLEFLRIDEEWNPLKNIFESKTHSVHELMKVMLDFFKKRDSIANSKHERGDRLKISDSKGNPYNICGLDKGINIYIDKAATIKVQSFMEIIGELTSWNYNKQDWICWKNLKYYKFTKRDFKSEKKNVNNGTFNEFIAKNPLSWAMTSSNNIEYTLEEPSLFDFNTEYYKFLKDYEKNHPEGKFSNKQMDDIKKFNKA